MQISFKKNPFKNAKSKRMIPKADKYIFADVLYKIY